MPENNQDITPENESVQDIEIRSEEVQEILTHVPNWMIRWGNTLLLVFVIMLLAISWFVKYPDVIETQIMITTTNPPQKLFANAAGKFDVFLVNDNDTVAAETPLAIIKNSANYSDVLLLKSIIDTISIDASNFEFPIDDLPPLILGDIGLSFSNFENSYYEYESERRYDPYKNQYLSNKYSLLAAKGRLENAKEQRKLAQKDYENKKNDFENRQKRLLKSGAISQQEFEEKESIVLNLQSTLKNLDNQIFNLREAINASSTTIKGASIEQQQKSTRLIKQVLQSYSQLRKDIQEWELRFVLTSNIDGQVSYMSYWDKNQTVNAGAHIFTVVPIKERSYIGKIEAPAANSGKIKKLQEVQIQLANFPSDEYGELNGSIVKIPIVPNQDGNYLIDVSIDKELETTYGRKIPFRQEMKGSARIITEDLRLMERFFYQLKNVLN